MADQKFEIEIIAKIDKLEKGLNNAMGLLKKTGDVADEAGSKAAFGFDKLVKGAAIFIAIQKGAELAFGALKDYGEAQAGVNRLNLALANMGNYSAAASSRLQDLAGRLQDTTAFSDDAAMAAQGILASFGALPDEIEKMMPTIADFAAATGQGLPEAAELMAKAMVGNTEILKRHGIIVDTTASKSDQFKQAMEQLQTRFGGAAQAELQTFGGQMKQLGNTWGEVSEAAGMFFSTLLSGVGSLSDITKMVKAVSKFIRQNLIGAFFDLKAVVVDTMASIYEANTRLALFLHRLTGLKRFKDMADESTALAKSLRDQAQELRDLAGADRSATKGTTDTKSALERTRIQLDETTEAAKKQRKAMEDLAKAYREAEKDFGELTRLGGESFLSGARMSSIDQLVAGSRPEDRSDTATGMVGALSAWEAKYGDINKKAAEVNKRIQDGTNKNKLATYEWGDALKDLSNAFQILGIDGNSVLGQLIGGFMHAAAAASRVRDTMRRNEDAGGRGGFGGMSIGQKIGVGIEGLGVAANILRGGGGAKGAISGIAQGASFGAAFGGIGAAIGGVVGGILGLFGSSPAKKAAKTAGRILGENVSEEMGKQMLERAKELGITIEQLAGRMLKERKFQKESEAAQKAEGGLQHAIGGLAAFGKLQGAAAEQGRIFTGLFWAAVKEFGIGPAIDAFKEQFEAIKDSIPGLGGIAEFFATFSEGPARDAADAATGFAQQLAGIAAAGFLTRDMLADFGTVAQAAYDQAIAGGATHEQALMAIAPLLANLRRLYEEVGIPIDANTQKLIDQAEQAGITFKTDPLLRMVEVLEAIAKALGADIPAAADRARDAIDRVGNAGGEGGGRGERNSEYYAPGELPIQAQSGFFSPSMPAGGGRGGGTPMMVHPGEEVAVSPAGSGGIAGAVAQGMAAALAGAGGGGGSQTFVIQIGNEILKKVIERSTKDGTIRVHANAVKDF